MKEKLHFAHGNGFPSPAYKQLLDQLEQHFDCCYIDRIGHSPTFPVTQNWHALVDELIHSIKAQSTEPVIAVGHSLGGVLSFLAAIEEPSLFKSVILLDSPIIGPIKSQIIHLSKVLGMIDYITPAFKTRGRKHHWKTRGEALTYLKSRALFKPFTDACLNDYIDYGMHQDQDGYSLRFDKQVEYQIYRTIPHILHEYEGKLEIPAALIYGSNTNIIHSTDLSYMKNNYGIVNYKIKGTHMFPMEYPIEAAKLIIKAVDRLKT